MPGKWFFRTIFLLWCLAILGCNVKSKALKTFESAEKEGSEKKLKIGFVPKGSSIYWKCIQTGALKAAHDLGVELIWQDPIREDNYQLQAQVVQNMINRNLDAMILAPVNGTSLIPSAKETKAKNIPLIIVDSELSSPDFVT